MKYVFLVVILLTVAACFTMPVCVGSPEEVKECRDRIIKSWRSDRRP